VRQKGFPDANAPAPFRRRLLETADFIEIPSALRHTVVKPAGV
jgi:hypothetical protein